MCVWVCVWKCLIERSRVELQEKRNVEVVLLMLHKSDNLIITILSIIITVKKNLLKEQFGVTEGNFLKWR